METPRVLLLVLFLLLICRSFQYGNFTSSDGLSPVASLTGNAVVIVTLEARQVDQVTLSTQDSSGPGSPTSTALPHSVTSYQQRVVPPAGPSNSSIIDVEASLNNSPIQAEESPPNNVATEVTC
ncbi:hypothetical protein OIDMADRAFT_175478 [Oidiodendron maius Zn]|uniref:Uncharacterized protein n=1 Tax=Oidiodendron maius (strain Zn) TaxID=913774 RepID=A0A0C3E307_OIDMZ|nr:hypothetical protein OIDMADRAFT_175478 [Oidiodendron maius Zn]